MLVGRAVPGRRLRVGFYLDSSEMGGAELFLRGLLGALDPALEPLLLATDGAVAREVASPRPDLETVVVPPVRGRHDLMDLSTHALTLLRFGADVVHVNQRHLWSGQYGLLAARLAGSPAIGVVHGVFPHASESQRLLTLALTRRVARFVGVSRFAAAAIEQLLKIPGQRVVTIPNGVAAAGPAAFPAVHERDPRLVAVVGRLAHEKGVDVLVDALADVPGLHLAVVGDGTERGRLEQQVAALGLSERVRFVGWRSDPWSLRPSPSALVVPSRRDAAPLVILEAMQRALPVVASRVGGIGELVTWETGVLVPAEDVGGLAGALRWLVDRPDQLVAMGRRAAERARAEFGLELMAERYGHLYREVAGRSSPTETLDASGGAARPVDASSPPA